MVWLGRGIAALRLRREHDHSQPPTPGFEAVAGDKTYVGTICELKQFPAYLNRWDSQQARNEGVFAH